MVIFSCIYCNSPFDNKNGLTNHMQSRCNDGAVAANDNDGTAAANDTDGNSDDLHIELNFHDDDDYNNNISHNEEEDVVMAQTVLAVADKYDTLEELIDLDYESETSDVESIDFSTENDVMEEDNDDDSDNNPANECFNNITTNSLLNYKEVAETYEAKKEVLQQSMIVAIELLSLLRASGASLNLYDKIIYWVEERIPHTMKEPLPTRAKVIKTMEKRHNLNCMAPVQTKLILPSINLPIEIPVNPLLGCLYSLLEDQNLMKTENLLFNDIDDLSKVLPFSKNYSEINTGLAYHSFQQKIQHFGNAIQIPLVLFIDGTAIDRACRHSQTPVMFTLGIFNQLLRNRSKAWRNIGFIKNNIKEQYSQQQINVATENQNKYAKNHPCYVPDNHNDFHAQLGCIMNDLLRLQKHKRGIKWRFKIDGKQQEKVYRLFFTVLCFAGDTMEHNKLCSLRGGSFGKFPCCMCQTTRKNLILQMQSLYKK